ncbi:MAG: 3-mercaptopyruvate sulfurtransferase [Methylomonas sp.]|jgi:thiosulfate/3-mercaptopyruvate sulfurtransferase|uniref:3-mercaptopyruvate sulfurtransferase n=1 Tax=Methylomonas sp. TaxID=418 RepID=UPI0025F804E0|nr:3-mercaptopyruvate sulfurtransferase [Methylomonas sp.]MCK9606503.1 3-mercaptopyruvate sulfurtransferase [Methylomonas sp.]
MITVSLPDNHTPASSSALIGCEWLLQNIDRPNLVILDATFFLARQHRNARQAFERQHIPCAQFFDIDVIADQDSALPHTLPSAAQFARQMGQFGIDNDSRVIIYDHNHFFAAARVWWMFRVFGHDKVNVLDGGLTRWATLSYPLTAEAKSPASKPFNVVFQPRLYVDLQQLLAIHRQGCAQILDARSEDSFNGRRPLPDPALHPGHIPGSVNLPYQNLFNEEDHRLKPNESLQQLLSAAKVDCTLPMVASCGSGVSAALLILALYQLGIHNVPLYDGSWAEWGRRADLPRQTLA